MSSVSRKKPVSQEKSQNAGSSRQIPTEKTDLEERKNRERNIKKSSSKSLVKQTSTDKNSVKSSTLRPMLATKSQQNMKQTSVDSRKIVKKQASDSEKRGTTSVYFPKKSTQFVSETHKSVRNSDQLIDKNQEKSTQQKSRRSLERNGDLKMMRNVEKKSEAKPQNSSNRHQRLPSRERRKSRTLSPSEVKVLKNPGRASVKNIVKDTSSDYEYEDDFEDYESDFQECTDTSEASSVSDESQESEESPRLEPMEMVAKKTISKFQEITHPYEERMLDSGHYELQEARRRAARIELMSASRPQRIHQEVIVKPVVFPEEKPSEIRSLPSSADEGFEDGRSGDFAKSPPLPQEGTILRDISRKLVEKPMSRGQKLLQMIKLDTVEWSIFELTPIAYEEFITVHGKMNTRQIATQTNEDDLTVETQTEEIKYRNMWTQFPIVCRGNLISNKDVEQFNKELIGVGCDGDDIFQKKADYDVLQLNEFLGAAGKVVLALLEEQEAARLEPDADEGGNLIFSETTIKLAVSAVTFLSGRPVVLIRYSDLSSRVLLTIHGPADEDTQDLETSVNDDSYLTDCCIGCQWNVYEPSRPTKLFYSASTITAACLHPTNYNVVFGGLEDGSVSLWDLEEDEAYHPKFVDKDNNVEWVLRSPTFSTIGLGGEKNDEKVERCGKIVALRVLSKIESESREGRGNFIPIQICSLDEEGICIIWSVLKNLEINSPMTIQQLGQSWWGKIRLVKSHQIVLPKDELHNKNEEVDEQDNSQCSSGFRDLSVDTIDTNNLFIATNTSRILHATRTGKKLKPSVYNGHFIDYSATTCIESCPFGHPYFLAGFTDGTLRLYSTLIEKPLVQLKNLKSTAPVRIIQWSRSKPFTIYVLDEKSNIHIWDLSRSDISPQYTIPSKKYTPIGSMQLSPCRTDHDLANQYLALGLDNGTVEIHKFNRNFHYSSDTDRLAELSTFLYYVSVY